MGAESSRPAHSRAQHYKAAAAAAAADGNASGASLWEGVPPAILWLVQSQVRLLLTHHASSLLDRPELSLEVDDEDEDEDEDGDAPAASAPRRHGTLQPHEHAIAHAALRDRVIGPRLQRALDRLVPSQLSEAAFWDNFFSHVDVIKVRLVTDYLTAQDGVRSERTTKHEGWVQLYEAMEPEMRADVRQAAERIAARQKPPPPSAVELAMGIDSSRSNKRWQPDGEQWLKYVEDGPSDIERVLRAAIAPPPAQAPAADVIAGIKQATVDISDPPAGAPAASTAGSTLPGYTPERVLREPLAGGQLSAEEEKDLL